MHQPPVSSPEAHPNSSILSITPYQLGLISSSKAPPALEPPCWVTMRPRCRCPVLLARILPRPSHKRALSFLGKKSNALQTLLVGPSLPQFPLHPDSNVSACQKAIPCECHPLFSALHRDRYPLPSTPAACNPTTEPPPFLLQPMKGGSGISQKACLTPGCKATE